MTRATRARIDLNALRNNLSISRQTAPESRVMAVIKANGYGHGLIQVARALENADAFAVATIDEAIWLRDTGIQHPIVVLEGCMSKDEFETAAKRNLQTVVHHQQQLDLLLEIESTEPMGVWLKIDTGMHRLGIAVSECTKAYTKLMLCDSVAKPIRVMTHFANADNPSDTYTETQISEFHNALKDMDCERSLANSAGLMAWPTSHADWIRPGIMLYGASPFMNKTAAELGLKPVMTLESQLIAINQFKKSDPVGYGGSYKCEEDMPIGVVSIGYGDGYPRHATTGTPILVNNKKVGLVGRVSMDMISVDLRSQPQARIGDPVTLWGKGLPIEEVAMSSGTISYELLCRVTSRVPFKYIG